MKDYKYIIIGGGTTAGYAAKAFIEQNIKNGELCIVSAESTLPMNRPPFSKDYLRDKSQDDEILIHGKEFYDKYGIDVKLESVAEEMKFGHKQVVLRNGDVLSYEKLLIATGSKLKRLDIEGSELKNIFYLRDQKQSDDIRKHADKADHVIVVGGGYIGTETAAVLNQSGLKVTMIVPEERLLARFASADIGSFFQNQFQRKGIELIMNDSVKGFHGKEKVEEVELLSGKRLKTDMVVAGIGVEPNIDIFKNTQLNINKGILVNEYCETNIEDVYAAGDVVEFPDMVFGKSRVVEHWEHAFEQGQHVAKVMTGKRDPYIFLPFFFSDIFEYSYEYFGDNESADEIRNRGDVAKGDFSTWWFEGTRLVAAFVMSSRPEAERKLAREWISRKTDIDKEKIGDNNIKMDDLVLNTGLHDNES
jgi:3-phenylpropionate/trans-cinnamate dioxygenase ferredoxin reductase component